MSPRFIKTTSKTRKLILKILSNFFKNKTKGVPEILSNYFNTQTQGVKWNSFKILQKPDRGNGDSFKLYTSKIRQAILKILLNFKNHTRDPGIVSNYFKNKIKENLKILSNWFKNKTKGVPETLSNSVKNQIPLVPRFFQSTSKTKQGVPKILSNYLKTWQGIPRLFQTTSRNKA